MLTSIAAAASPPNKVRTTILTLALMAAAGALIPPCGLDAQIPLVDHHQHLSSPANNAESRVPSGQGLPTSAKALVAYLDAAGIRQAVVLSVAYQWGSPSRSVAEEYEHVKAENDWTSAQVSHYPERLRVFCSVNPLKSYALEEIARCSNDPRLRLGLKLHFGNSDVDVHDTAQVAQLQRVFRAASAHGMAIVAHIHANIGKHRPYGAAEARIFLDEILPSAPNVIVQIAHLAGAGDYDLATDSAAAVFAEAMQRQDPRTAHLYFDASGISIAALDDQGKQRMVARMRQIGIARILYGSDGATPGFGPREYWAAFKMLPLSEDELRTIASNVAPYLR